MIYSPKTKDELIELIKIKDNNTYFIAGGTDIIIKIKNKKLTDYNIIDLTKMSEFAKIEENDSTVSIGSIVTMTELTESELIKKYFHSVYQAAYHLGSEQIRNLATVGGNLANASQSADVLLALYSLNAKIKILNSLGEEKIIPIEELILGREKTSLADDEVIESIILEKKDNQITGFCKIGSRKAVTISKISCAVNLIVKDSEISNPTVYLGAVGVVPTRAKLIEEYLSSVLTSEIDLKKLQELASEEVDLAIPTRESRHYKRVAIKGLMDDLLQDLKLWIINLLEKT